MIAHNAIAYFHDGIGISTYGTPGKDPERRASSIDIYGNDIHMLDDDFIETDGGVHNVRVFNNRGVNAAQGGYSSQPVFGGPVYFIRNILYHVPDRRGVQVLRQARRACSSITTRSSASRLLAIRPPTCTYRNNLFLGRDTPDRGDHGLGERDRCLQHRLQWLPAEQRREGAVHVAGTEDGQRLYEPKPDDWKTFATLAEFRAATGQEAHGIEVDFDIFEKLAPPDPVEASRGLSRDGPELPTEAGQQGGGCGCADSDRQRRLRRPRAGSRRAGSRANRSLTTDLAG